ncbi:MAG: alpha/beta hydrolase [Chloroflexi bacterium]|nr:alpha/beta hydrolase [Chloroflexota bacterium]
MATIQLNSADIYYQVYGQDQPGRVPILLIHGSTITGEIDWAELAPRLAAEYKVFVPDCRGHGRSSNPAGGYSFKQMAADAAAFVSAMGYKRMHIIGHSNGGNVALVLLMEHAGVVQTAVLQAANAYVTDYLREREPVVLEPDYFAAHHPQDVALMISAHGGLHGQDYWRELLNMTMREIIAEPNYTAADLAQVRRPVLAIMGADDQVNAPDRHAQFIAENIPQAEAWVPERVGHNVHAEIPDEWLTRLLDFLARRG